MGVLPLKVLVAKLFKMIPKPLLKFIMIDFKLLSNQEIQIYQQEWLKKSYT